ncbi:hypothetical protein CSC17_5171 [Klebsiella oxytoca]|uniref:hypothetical protein n=1 Tax=Klebsiella oxytoca TaxID=571 RepID=UPI000D529595|nr:hypothetical protein [Klebsiella oxytoca]AWF35703.1 hypothetical protein CSC17_5171 [Klebsiella oxytoca]
MDINHSEIIKKISNYNKKAVKTLNELPPDTIDKILKLSILSNKSLIIHDIKKRKQRNAFFDYLKNEMQIEKCKNEVTRIHTILKGTECLYDKIKDFIKGSHISKHSIDKQIWAHINRTESEFQYIYEKVNTDIENSTIANDGLTGLYIQGEDGETAQVDIAIEAYNHYLCMYLKMVAYENNLYDINGILTLPQEVIVDDESIYEAGSILASSISWLKLEEFSVKSLFFGGHYSMHPACECLEKDNSPTESLEGKYVHAFNMVINNYLLSDLISNARYFFKKYQNNIEISLQEQDPEKFLEKMGLKDITEFSSLVFLEQTLFLEENIFSKDFGGLTLIEWIIGYSELSLYVKKNINNPILVVSRSKLEGILNSRIESIEKVRLFIKYLTFSKNSKDLFDSPLIQVKGSKYYICKPSLTSISIDEAILSTFSTQKIKIDKKGYNFEKYINKNIKELGLECDSFSFKVGVEQYEYDCVLVIDDKVFILECKNRTPTKNQIINIINKQKDLLEHIEQVQRLKEGLLNNPHVFQDKFGRNLNEYEILPVVLFNHPFTYPRAGNNVYVIDSSIFLRFFKKPYISMDIIQNGKSHNIYTSERFWQGEKPTADDFIKYINSPPQQTPFIEKIKSDSRGYPIDCDNILTGNDVVISNFL